MVAEGAEAHFLLNYLRGVLFGQIILKNQVYSVLLEKGVAEKIKGILILIKIWTCLIIQCS